MRERFGYLSFKISSAKKIIFARTSINIGFTTGDKWIVLAKESPSKEKISGKFNPIEVPVLLVWHLVKGDFLIGTGLNDSFSTHLPQGNYRIDRITGVVKFLKYGDLKEEVGKVKSKFGCKSE